MVAPQPEPTSLSSIQQEYDDIVEVNLNHLNQDQDQDGPIRVDFRVFRGGFREEISPNHNPNSEREKKVSEVGLAT